MLSGLSWNFTNTSVLPCFRAGAALRSIEVLFLVHLEEGVSGIYRVVGTGTCRLFTLLPSE